MTKLLLSSLLILSLGYQAQAQQLNQIETVEIGNGILKKKVYRKCGIDLTNDQLLKLVKNDVNLKQYYKPMALNYAGSSLFNLAGGILVAWPITESFYKDNPNWTLAFIGLGCYAVAIPFTRAYQKHTTNAIRYYNSGYKETGAIELNLGMSHNGIGLGLTF